MADCETEVYRSIYFPLLLLLGKLSLARALHFSAVMGPSSVYIAIYVESLKNAFPRLLNLSYAIFRFLPWLRRESEHLMTHLSQRTVF